MSLYCTSLKPFFDHGLVEEVFEVKNRLVFCTLAGYKLMAVITAPHIVQETGEYYAVIVEQGHVERFLDPSERTEAYRPEKTEFDEVIFFNDETLAEMTNVKAKVDAGELEPLYDPSFVKFLKKKYIEQQRPILERYGDPPHLSPKKALTLGILAFLFTDLGVPFFYIGRPLLGVLCIAVSVVSMATMFFPPMLLLCAFGIVVFPILILCGSVKDRKGRRIVTAKIRQTVEQVWSDVERYRRECL